MTYTKAVRAATETPIRDKRDILPKAGAHHNRSWVEHFLHAWTSLGPLIPNDNDGTSQRVSISQHCSHHVFLSVKATSWPLEARSLLPCDLSDRILRRQVTVENGEVASGLDRLRKCADHVLPGSETRQLCEVLGHCFPGDRHAIAIQIAVLQHILEHSGCAADIVKVFHHILAARLQVGKKRSLLGDAPEVLQGHVNTRRSSHRDQMDGRVGGASSHHHEPNRVLKRLLRQNVPRQNLQLHA
mmetsp:Transcript_16878/g.28045  ORF Transcript_16878/g.28045 Transcript_16878/m.28045 type:complete len:243 (-) Transcript_16878:913-1641(-)